ncbi:MAG: DUF3168 domain-containing protein [Pseudomonadota bacterium]
MTVLATQLVLTALATRLMALPGLAGFTLIDRAPKRGQLPSLRFGPVRQEPWDTGSSLGTRLDITVALTSQTGSLADILAAAEAMATDLAGAPLALTEGSIVDQTLHSIRVEHRPGDDLETASMTVTLHLDLGDRA